MNFRISEVKQMPKINYANILKKELARIEKESIKPRLLLHVCCAPCSSYVLEYLQNHFDITVYFYNPNISPESEYEFRKNELKRLIKEMCNDEIRYIDADYNPQVFFSAVKGLENEPEGKKRCEVCFNLRLESTAKVAKELNFDYFTTTLSISPLKNAELLNTIGENLAKKYDTRYLFSDFKKNEGYKRSIELSKEYDLYRQDYCGCVFSKNK